MKKKNLHLAIAMTCASISAHAQMYVCTKDSFDAFDHTKGTTTTFREDSLWVGRLGYRIARIDSITFCTPAHPVQALGWWGDVNNGFIERLLSDHAQQPMNDADWHQLEDSILQEDATFVSRLQEFCRLTPQERRVCLLLKLGISPAGIAQLTAHTKQSVTNTRSRLYEKAFGRKGKPSQWDEFILSL